MLGCCLSSEGLTTVAGEPFLQGTLQQRCLTIGGCVVRMPGLPRAS